MALLQLSNIQALGGIVNNEPVVQEIEWRDQTFEVHVKRLSYGAIETMHKAGGQTFNTRLIAECVDLGDGKMTFEQAYNLDPALANALYAAVMKVQEGDAEDPKTETSGTN